MINDFEKAISIVLEEEGGYVNDPKDPGGETNYGITTKVLQRAIAEGLLPTVAVKDLTPFHAKIIYKAWYWDTIKGDQLPWPLCLFVLDASVNQGCDAASGFATQKMLQKVCGVPQDGILGTQTTQAASKGGAFMCQQFMARRALRYTGSRNFDLYGAGWLTRLFSVTMKGAK
jgi:lysozyme family protein